MKGKVRLPRDQQGQEAASTSEVCCFGTRTQRQEPRGERSRSAEGRPNHRTGPGG